MNMICFHLTCSGSLVIITEMAQLNTNIIEGYVYCKLSPKLDFILSLETLEIPERNGCDCLKTTTSITGVTLLS